MCAPATSTAAASRRCGAPRGRATTILRARRGKFEPFEIRMDIGRRSHKYAIRLTKIIAGSSHVKRPPVQPEWLTKCKLTQCSRTCNNPRRRTPPLWLESE